jgi:hypothetical protein
MGRIVLDRINKINRIFGGGRHDQISKFLDDRVREKR